MQFSSRTVYGTCEHNKHTDTNTETSTRYSHISSGRAAHSYLQKQAKLHSQTCRTYQESRQWCECGRSSRNVWKGLVLVLVLVLDAGVVADVSTAGRSQQAAAADCAAHLGPGTGVERRPRNRPSSFCASGSRSRERDLRARQRSLCGSMAAGAGALSERPGSLPE